MDGCLRRARDAPPGFQDAICEVHDFGLVKRRARTEHLVEGQGAADVCAYGACCAHCSGVTQFAESTAEHSRSTRHPASDEAGLAVVIDRLDALGVRLSD